MGAFREIGFVQGIIDGLTSGHGRFRLIVQPLFATLVGARLGIADAREGKVPFLLRMFTTSGRRAHLMVESLRGLIVPMALAMVVDGVVQYFTLGVVRPVAAFVVGLLLVWLPYAVARALANRVVSAHAHAH